MVIDVDADGNYFGAENDDTPRVDVKVTKAKRDMQVSPERWELLLECGKHLSDVVYEASPHKQGDRQVVLSLAESGKVSIGVKHAKASNDFDDAGMENEQIAVSCYLMGAGAMRATPEQGNPVRMIDDKKGVRVQVASVEALAGLINAKARAAGEQPPIARALLMSVENEAKATATRAR